MSRHFKFVCFVGVVFSLVGCKPQLKEFSSTEGRFKVMLPGTPREYSRTPDNIVINMYGMEDKNGAYFVGFTDLLPATTPSADQIKEFLSKARDSAMLNMNASLTKETPITLAGNHLGCDVEGSIPDKDSILRARFYYVDGRIYYLFAVGNRPWANSAEATTFLDSLVLTP